VNSQSTEDSLSVKVESMSTTLKDFQKRARALAASGTFAGWRALVFELQFEPGYAEAFRWLYGAATKEELERLCSEARIRRGAA
jgi:uncharacterized membrane protein